jgi:hypothetical protein
MVIQLMLRLPMNFDRALAVSGTRPLIVKPVIVTTLYPVTACY